MTKNDTPARLNDIVRYANDHDFGELHFKLDPKTNLLFIVAVHNTTLGPALGGCRFIEYPNVETALYDAMRLARGMSYKAAIAGLPLGGGKAVILKPKTPFDRTECMRKFGQFVENLNGQYITAIDSGTSTEDMDIVAQETSYVSCMAQENGDPSPYTVEGILQGIQAAVKFQLGKDQVDGLHIAIQGLGHVGLDLAGRLHRLGARLSVADVNPVLVQKAVSEFGATGVDVKKIHQCPCDVFAPCALGGILNDTTIAELQTTVVAGGANNQLAHTYHGKMLHDKGILYATDYVINSGGLIFAASYYLEKSIGKAEEKIRSIYDSLLTIFERSKAENRSTGDIADMLAQEKLGL